MLEATPVPSHNKTLPRRGFQTTRAVGITLKTRTQSEGSRNNRKTPLASNSMSETVFTAFTEESAGNERRHDVFTNQARSFLVTLSELNFSLEDVNVTVVQMKALVRPIIFEPHDAMRAST